jgi:hypothetical protein
MRHKKGYRQKKGLNKTKEGIRQDKKKDKTKHKKGYRQK